MSDSKMFRASVDLAEKIEDEAIVLRVKLANWAIKELGGVNAAARLSKQHPGNVSNLYSGKRRPGRKMMRKLLAALESKEREDG